MKLIVFVLIMMTLINCGKIYDDAVKAYEKKINYNYNNDDIIEKVIKTAIFIKFPILAPMIEFMEKL